jgi:hypothetical protein
MGLNRQEENQLIEEIIERHSFGEDREAKRLLQRILAEKHLTDNDITSQNLTQLKISLQKIEELIEKFGKLQDQSDPFASMTAIHHLPILLATKELIVDRIRSSQSAEEIRDIVSQAEKGSFTDLEQRLEKLIDINEDLVKTSLETEKARKEAEAASERVSEEIARRREEREAFKEKWAIRQSLLARESVSTIIGGLLLILITLAQIVAAFLHVTTSQILDNAFLVLLGYFFGQTIAKVSGSQKDQ